MRSDLSSSLSVPEGSSSLSRVFPPSISFLVVLFLVSPPHTPASSPFPCHPSASHDRNISLFVSPLFASMSSLLLSVLSLPVYVHLFFSQSRIPSASSSKSTFRMLRFSSLVLWFLSMPRTHTAPLVLSWLLLSVFTHPKYTQRKLDTVCFIYRLCM